MHHTSCEYLFRNVGLDSCVMNTGWINWRIMKWWIHNPPLSSSQLKRIPLRNLTRYPTEVFHMLSGTALEEDTDVSEIIYFYEFTETSCFILTGNRPSMICVHVTRHMIIVARSQDKINKNPLIVLEHETFIVRKCHPWIWRGWLPTFMHSEGIKQIPEGDKVKRK